MGESGDIVLGSRFSVGVSGSVGVYDSWLSVCLG